MVNGEGFFNAQEEARSCTLCNLPIGELALFTSVTFFLQKDPSRGGITRVEAVLETPDSPYRRKMLTFWGICCFL